LSEGKRYEKPEKTVRLVGSVVLTATAPKLTKQLEAMETRLAVLEHQMVRIGAPQYRRV